MFTKQWLFDTIERLSRTFVQAWLGAWLAISGHSFGDLFAQDVLVVGASATALALITALGVSTFTQKNVDDSSVLKRRVLVAKKAPPKPK